VVAVVSAAKTHHLRHQHPLISSQRLMSQNTDLNL